MATFGSLGRAIRNSASSTRQPQRQPRPSGDPDGVIADQVISQIANNTSNEFREYLNVARDRMQSAPQPPQPPPPPPVNLGELVRNSISPYDMEYIKDQTGWETPYDPNDPFNQPLPPDLHAPGYDNQRPVFVPRPAVRMPDFPYQAPGDTLARQLLGQEKSFPVYEDGSFRMGRPLVNVSERAPTMQERLGVTPSPFALRGAPTRWDRDIPRNTSETGYTIPVPQAEEATPVPVPEPGVPFGGELSPEIILILRMLGMIQ